MGKAVAGDWEKIIAAALQALSNIIAHPLHDSVKFVTCQTSDKWPITRLFGSLAFFHQRSDTFIYGSRSLRFNDRPRSS